MLNSVGYKTLNDEKPFGCSALLPNVHLFWYTVQISRQRIMKIISWLLTISLLLPFVHIFPNDTQSRHITPKFVIDFTQHSTRRCSSLNWTLYPVTFLRICILTAFIMWSFLKIFCGMRVISEVSRSCSQSL